MRPRRLERVIELALLLSAALSVLTTAGIIIVLAVETFQFLREVPLREFLTGTEWTPLFAVASLRRAAVGCRHAARRGDRDGGGPADGTALAQST